MDFRGFASLSIIDTNKTSVLKYLYLKALVPVSGPIKKVISEARRVAGMSVAEHDLSDQHPSGLSNVVVKPFTTSMWRLRCH